MTEVITKRILLDQEHTSRERDVLRMLDKQLNMQFGIEVLDPEERLIDLKPDGDMTRFLLEGPDADRFACVLGRVFPFLHSPMDIIERCAARQGATVADLIGFILEKVGAS